MGTARRDFLKFSAGAVAGLGLSPVPWKLLDDTSIWTQNWSWTPKLPRGEVSFKPSACTLCPRGCAIMVRCVGNQPVGVRPRDGSTMCGRGFQVHQAAYRPDRIRTTDALEPALKEINEAMRAGRTLAIVDPAPGRSVSSVYRKLVAETPRALYIADPEPTTLRAYEEIAGVPFRSATVALDKVRTVVAVEADVLERWGPPGLLMRRRSELQVIYAGENGGVTADLADRCIPISAVESTVAESEKPALVIGGEHLPWSAHLTLAAMNRELGAVQVRKEPNEGAAPTRIETIQDGSIELLIVDGAGVPLKELRPKLRQDCTVIAISASANEYTRMAKFVIAAPAPLEAEADLPSPFDQSDSAPRTAEAVVEGGTGVSPRDFFAGLKGELT